MTIGGSLGQGSERCIEDTGIVNAGTDRLGVILPLDRDNEALCPFGDGAKEVAVVCGCDHPHVH